MTKKEKALEEIVKAFEVSRKRTISLDRNFVNIRHNMNDGTVTRTKHGDIANNAYTADGFSCIIPFYYDTTEENDITIRTLVNKPKIINHVKGRLACLKLAVNLMTDNEGKCYGHKVEGMLNGTPNLIGAPRHSKAQFNYLNITNLAGKPIRG